MIEIPENFILRCDDTPFPDVESALSEPNGLLAIGGSLSTKRLIDAYQRGIFPWYSEGEPVLWYSPNPRMVITKDRLHISKSLEKTLRKKLFEIRIDYDFKKVIQSCRDIKRNQQTGTWIDDDMVKSYCELHDKGYARSVEVYIDNELVGGLYGVSLGQVFFGESMFSRVNNASKAALVHLVNNMTYQLVDCQVESQHLKSLGAYNIERSAFIKLLKDLM